MPLLEQTGLGDPAIGQSWRSRPLAAGLVRIGIAAVPVAAALAAAMGVTALWTRPRAVGAQAGWWASTLAAAAAASYLAARAARRLLPLAVLLRLSLAFPDRTPSRFAVALRAGTLSNLKARAHRLTAAGTDVPMADAAREVILLAVALTSHDRGTRGHSERVRAITDVLAEELRLSPVDRDRLQWAGLLHDIGKVSVPAAILNKAGPLDDEEWEVMRRHPTEGAKLLGPLAEWLGPWAEVIPQHHERYNGSGYPNGLAGSEICFGARIVAVADTFEVMTSARSYKRPFSAEAARQEISAQAGDLFDPDVARALLNVSLGRLRWIGGPLAWLVAGPVLDRLEAAGQAVQSAAQSSLTVAAAGTVAAVVAVAPPQARVASAPAARPRATAPAAEVLSDAANPAPTVPADANPLPADATPAGAPLSPASSGAAASPAAPAALPSAASPAAAPVANPAPPSQGPPPEAPAPHPDAPLVQVNAAKTTPALAGQLPVPVSAPASPVKLSVGLSPGTCTGVDVVGVAVGCKPGGPASTPSAPLAQ